MKKLLFLLLSVSFLAVSCSKDDIDTVDLASKITGVYEGKIAFSTTGSQNAQIRVTKLSNNEVQIEPFVGSDASSFAATLSEDDGYIYLKIPEQKIEGGSIRGNINVSEGFPDDHGAYEFSTKALGYALVINYNGVVYDELFAGVKK